ncbi:MAG: hypothetical protein COU66_02535 [Candidatus Pacebacteria bacterium CG10_big_fil_rev_8_21_14_0_10_44_11]|nr:MAG: hypothetical protein COU66_02535 [Candidatus Pacebacteria bacterium CG10_big_fil_rev_8_21_14_0_10_44_11]
MKYLFIFAHPDDETVACAGTIRQLVDQGDEVALTSVTPGEAGEVQPSALKKLRQAGSVSKLRQAELNKVAKALGIHQVTVLAFQDGTITNQLVWGKLQQDLIDQIDRLLPDVIITFDHTGWYFHLDHVGVSIAVTLAFHKTKHRPLALLHSHFQPGGKKWKYIFHASPATHRVLVRDTHQKLATMELHQSQDLQIPKAYVIKKKRHYEFFELACATKKGKKLFSRSPIFSQIKK